MRLRLHHINISTDDMALIDSFYEDALGLKLLTRPPMVGQTDADSDGTQAWGNNASFFSAGDDEQLQIHTTLRRPYAPYENDQYLNPLIAGHFCFRTDDMDAVVARLAEHGIPYSEYGAWAVQGWRQIFLSDPAGNIIEIHEVEGGVYDDFVSTASMRLHHVNVCTDDLDQLDDFYSNAIGLPRLAQPAMVGKSESDPEGVEEWGGSTHFYSAGDEEELQLHVSQRRPYESYEQKQNINPLIRGHLSFRTGDLNAALRRLDERGIPYSDFGRWEMQGWRQVFLSDPCGNVIEIHQVDEA